MPPLHLLTNLPTEHSSTQDISHQLTHWIHTGSTGSTQDLLLLQLTHRNTMMSKLHHNVVPMPMPAYINTET